MVLGPSETEEERNHIGDPSVIRVAGIWYMYYEAPCAWALSRRPDGSVAVGDEFRNQVFVATSSDGLLWRKHPDDARPRPIVAAPPADIRRPRYGIGQPSVFHRGGKFVLHCVDSSTAPGDWIVRIEADDPFFRTARRLPTSLAAAGAPPGAVARFAQADVRSLGDLTVLVRPAYGTGNLGILVSRDGTFDADRSAVHPAEVFPQIRIADPRGPGYRERLFPRLLTGPGGEIILRGGLATVFHGSGLGFKEKAWSWDIHRCEVDIGEALRAAGSPPARRAMSRGRNP
jgi:hypothetical protein